MCPLVGIGLTELPKTGGPWPPATLLPASLHSDCLVIIMFILITYILTYVNQMYIYHVGRRYNWIFCFESLCTNNVRTAKMTQSFNIHTSSCFDF